MNANFKKLAKQAGMEDYPTYGVNALYGEADIEQFAKLIVEECTRIAKRCPQGDFVAETIEEYFGVK
ncbi:MAG TPA: hypothetical protein VFM18_18060 [Methanosarcina sp.]|nr:hypothetical protein [Methanosarcina sp.]